MFRLRLRPTTATIKKPLNSKKPNANLQNDYKMRKRRQLHILRRREVRHVQEYMHTVLTVCDDPLSVPLSPTDESCAIAWNSLHHSAKRLEDILAELYKLDEE